MSVPDTDSRHSYVGRGDTGPYVIDFDVILDDSGNATDIVVKLLDSAGTETDITSLCTVTGLNVTTSIAYSSAYSVVLVRYPEMTQPYTFAYKTDIPAKRIEEAMDRLACLIQRNALEADLSLKGLLSEPIPGRLPSRAARASKLLGFDATGDNPIPSAGTAVAVSTFMATVVGDLTADAARRTLLVDQETILTSDAVLETQKKYRAKGRLSLTLPASATEGERIEIYTEDVCLLLQSDANHAIQYKNRHFTTKGAAVAPPSAAVAGLVILPPHSRIVIAFKGTGSSRLSAPAAVGSNLGAGLTVGTIAYSPDGKYFAVGISATPFVKVWKKDTSGDTWTEVAALPAGVATPTYLSWSGDGTYLAVSSGTTPFLQIYKRSGDSFTIVGGVVAAAGAASAARFSPDGIYVAVVENNTQPEIYKRTVGTDTFTKLSNPPVLVGASQHCAWSRDGVFLACSNGTTPFMQVYRRQIDTFVLVAALPAAAGALTEVEFSSDGLWLISMTSTTPDIWRRDSPSSEAFVLVSTGMGNPGSGPKLRSMAVSPDDRWVVCGFAVQDLNVFRRTMDDLVLLGVISTPAAGTSERGTFSPDGRYLITGSSVSPQILAWKLVEDLTKVWAVEVFDSGMPTNMDLLFK